MYAIPVSAAVVHEQAALDIRTTSILLTVLFPLGKTRTHYLERHFVNEKEKHLILGQWVNEVHTA